jgi:hypothetical protein
MAKKDKKGSKRNKASKKTGAKKKAKPKRTGTKSKASRSKKKAKDEGPEEMEVPDGDQWLSPVCFDARSLSQVLREVLEQCEFKFTRTQSDKLYHQTLVLFPLPKSAYVFRFQIRKPIKLFIDLYDTKPSHAGIIPYMEIHGLNEKRLKALFPVLETLIQRLPRPPWQFTIQQRLQHGLLIPEWGRAKKAWRRLGFRV